MPEVENRRHIRRSRWFVGTIAAVIVGLLVVVLMLEGRFTSPPEETPAPPTATAPLPSDGGGTRSPTPEPATVPFSSVEKLKMIFPEKQSTDEASFTVEAGATYLLSFDVGAEKPAGSKGNGFMLGLSLRCMDQDGRPVATIGGTENLLTAQPVTFSNQTTLTPSRNGVVTCSMLANAPEAPLAARGTRFTVDVTWKVTRPVGLALPALHQVDLPAVIPSKSSQTLLTRDVPVASLTQRRLDVLVSLQLTTCTGTGGSTEDGTQWCTEENIDPTGSHFRFEIRFDVIGADGKVCGSIDSGRRQEYLDTYRHHQLYHVAKSVTVPSALCGDRIRTSVNVTNQGPAGLLVHRAGTSMVTLETRPVG